ncbi:MAG: L,D-transpeptidase family protein [Woeseia sp.]
MNRMAVAASIVLCLAPTLCLGADAVPAYVLELPETVSEVLIADTRFAALHRFGRTASGIEEIDQRYMSIGLNGVGKERAWDRKTPLGIYFITERLNTTNLDDKYGVAAYPLDYPNAWDRYNQRTGDGIWLHGVNHNGSTRPPRDTDGCLALPNSELLSLGDTLKPLTTPVIVTRELTWSTRGELEKLRVELRTALELWRQSLQERDRSTYLSLYSDDFRHGEMDKAAWTSRRSGSFDARGIESVDLADVMLMADPEEPGLYLSRFTQEFETGEGKVKIIKRLYWRRQADENWQIVAEDSG